MRQTTLGMCKLCEVCLHVWFTNTASKVYLLCDTIHLFPEAKENECYIPLPILIMFQGQKQ